MNIVVTGGTGVLGYHLLHALQEEQGQLYSFSDRQPEQYRMVSQVHYYNGDLLKPDEVRQFIKEVQPDEVYHIASKSSMRIAQNKPIETLTVNIMGTYHLLEAIRLEKPNCKVLIVSNSEVYGRGEGLLDVLHEEDHRLNPLSPLATSKACMEMVAHQFRNAWNIPIVIARPFHSIGPYHAQGYLLPHIASQLIDIKRNMGEPVLYTGNLDVSRDIIDVRDMTRAFTLIMRNGVSGEAYNVCSGEARTLREMTEYLIILSNLQVDIRVDIGLERQVDIPMLIGNPDKLKQATGWKPLISVEDSLSDLYREMELRAERESKQMHFD